MTFMRSYYFLMLLFLLPFNGAKGSSSEYRLQITNDFKTYDITTEQDAESSSFNMTSNNISIGFGKFLKANSFLYLNFNRSLISDFNNSSYGLGYRYYFIGGRSLYFKNEFLNFKSHHMWSWYADLNYSKFNLNASGFNLIFDQYEMMTGLEYNVFEDHFLVCEIKAAYLYQSAIRDGFTIGLTIGVSKNF